MALASAAADQVPQVRGVCEGGGASGVLSDCVSGFSGVAGAAAGPSIPLIKSVLLRWLSSQKPYLSIWRSGETTLLNLRLEANAVDACDCTRVFARRCRRGVGNDYLAYSSCYMGLMRSMQRSVGLR